MTYVTILMHRLFINHKYLFNYNRYNKFLLSTESFNNILNLNCNKSSPMRHNYNIKYIKITLFATFAANFSKL